MSSKISALSPGLPVQITDKFPVARGAGNAYLTGADLSHTFSFSRPVCLMFDGDSKSAEPLGAIMWAKGLAPNDAIINYSNTYNLGVGGSTTANSANNLTNTTRMATMTAAVQANISAGFDVDMWLTIGTNDAQATTNSETVIANIAIYHAAFLAAGGRYLILMAVDPLYLSGGIRSGYNNAYSDYCQNHRAAIFCETAPYWLDQTLTTYGPIGGNTTVAGSMTSDGLGIHAGGYGIWQKRLAVQPILSRLYNSVRIHPLSKGDVFDQTNFIRANVIGGIPARFTAIGGTAGCTLSGTGSETGTPPLGWSSSGTLNNIQATWTATTSAALDTYCGTTGNPCVRLALTGTAGAAGNVQIRTTGFGAWTVTSAYTKWNAVMSLNASNITYISSGVDGLVGNPGVQAGWGATITDADKIPTITGLFSIGGFIFDTLNNAGVWGKIIIGWGNGHVLNGTTIDFIGMDVNRAPTL